MKSPIQKFVAVAGGSLPIVERKENRVWTQCFEEAIAESLCIGSRDLGDWQKVEYYAMSQGFIGRDELGKRSGLAKIEARFITMLLGTSGRGIQRSARQPHRVELCASGYGMHRMGIRESVQATHGTGRRLAGGF